MEEGCVSEAVVCSVVSSVGSLSAKALSPPSLSRLERDESSVHPAADKAIDAVSITARILILFDILSLLLAVDNIQYDACA